MCHRSFSARATEHSAPVPRGIQRLCHRAFSACASGHSAPVSRIARALSIAHTRAAHRASCGAFSSRATRHSAPVPRGIQHLCHRAFNAYATGHSAPVSRIARALPIAHARAAHRASCEATRQPPGGHRARGSPAPQGIQRTCHRAFSACHTGHLAPVSRIARALSIAHARATHRGSCGASRTAHRVALSIDPTLPADPHIEHQPPRGHKGPGSPILQRIQRRNMTDISHM